MVKEPIDEEDGLIDENESLMELENYSLNGLWFKIKININKLITIHSKKQSHLC